MRDDLIAQSIVRLEQSFPTASPTGTSAARSVTAWRCGRSARRSAMVATLGRLLNSVSGIVVMPETARICCGVSFALLPGGEQRRGAERRHVDRARSDRVLHRAGAEKALIARLDVEMQLLGVLLDEFEILADVDRQKGETKADADLDLLLRARRRRCRKEHSATTQAASTNLRTALELVLHRTATIVRSPDGAIAKSGNDRRHGSYADRTTENIP